MTQELREKVIAAIKAKGTHAKPSTLADAAIALVLEEAAKVCELSADDACYDYEDAALRQAAAAIRALAKPNNGLTEPSAEVSATP